MRKKKRRKTPPDQGNLCRSDWRYEGIPAVRKIYDPKWENATTTEKSIKEAINMAVDKVKTDVNVICGMRSKSAGKLWKNIRIL